MVLTGFAANRMNTAITGMEIWPTRTYFPSLMEVLIMLGIAAIGFSAFSLIAGYLPIFQPEPPAPLPDEPWTRLLTH
jgi:Ni/Fe-hydrogenase subunit HybB-like protein